MHRATHRSIYRKEEASLSLIPEFDETQLAAARAKAWHQDSNPLLNADAVLEWLTNYGLVLFAPRPLQLPSPAPSLVEATLGATSGGPTAEQIDSAQEFVGRMVADGTAIPLNLMGVVGETPDFVVSAQVFSYVFTLRGDKAWKQPPATSGAVKVSPLGLKAYEVLTEHRQLTALQLAGEMGREVTEAATMRVLVELWSQLRVLPLPQPGGQPALWELTTRRFTKSIKAGANAGQPSALSALISLYLTQAIAATEEEIVTFLSPLTARSRLREVLHALTGARKLETLAVEGKTLLHLPGALLTFAGVAAEPAGTESVETDGAEADVAEAVVRPRPKKIGTGRISSFSAERKPAAEFRGKPVRSFKSGVSAGAARGGSRPSPRSPAKFAPRADGKSESERRPFRKTESSAKPSFTNPWKEDKKARPASAPDSFTKYRKPEAEDRKPLGPREQAGLPPERRSAPKTSFDRGSKPGGFGSKPGGFAKRPYTPRTAEGGERSSFKPRSFEKFGEKSGGFAGKRPYTPRPSGDGERPSFKPRAFERGAKPYAKPGGYGAKRPFTPRPSGDGERPSFKPRTYERGAGERSSKPGGFAAKRPYTPRAKESGASSFAKRSDAPAMTGAGERTIPKRPYKPRAADADQRVFTKAPWVPPTDGGNERGGKRPFKARSGGGFDKAKPRKPFGAKFGGKPGGFNRKKPGAEE